MSIDAMASAVKSAGSQTALAKILGCTPQNVQRMCATGKVPAKHVLKIEFATGVSRSLLSPDLYPVAPLTLNQKVRAISPKGQAVEPSVYSSSSRKKAKLGPPKALAL